ncbi:hypothetical protein [Novosphingobium sp. Gsoil 351]|uniref:hypothetical protein n=1 Tax=Novosphingobium sp. Gsoil 351 TaxID=2675225 RepID=UPI0012B44592|nr:hypothetical protein [Novosphingobium sp. Gsoil 351]QGN56105.1 hypothetical protein GKE62_17695 [Novosphingobium sp. Gsoil 351]
MRIVVVYDETVPVPRAISRIIGAQRFGDIVRRRQRLADAVRTMVEANTVGEYVRLIDEEQVPELLEYLQKLPSEAKVFRLPSSIVPLATDIFAALIAKLPYALSEVIYGEANASDAPTLLSRDNAVALLGERDAAGRRRFIQGLETQSVRVGNQARFADISQISTFLTFMSGGTEARHFNSTSQSGGVFRKRSRDKAKMRGEYSFFHIADEGMKRFLQPTFDFIDEDDNASYAMEQLSVPDAAMQIVHDTFDEATFDRFTDCFFAFLASRGRDAVGAAEVRLVGQRDIIDKLDMRIAQLRETPVGAHLDRWLEISGPHGSLDVLVDRCGSSLREGFARSQLDYLALSHGDPCFSNILYNSEINLFRLIDPRGSESREGAFMHPFYDVAKFSHSALGGYDFVNSGLAECKLNGRMQLSLAMERGGPPNWMKEAFRSKLDAHGWDVGLTRAIEASLFLSMLPLHGDSPEKLPAFCLIAGDILAELEDSV